MKITIQIYYKVILRYKFTTIVFRDEIMDYSVFDYNRETFEYGFTSSFSYKKSPWFKLESYNQYRKFINLYKKTIE